MKIKLAISVLVIALVALTTLPASADSFTFTVSNTSGTVSGSFSGLIVGLTNNSTGPASQVWITSFPAGLNSIVGGPPVNPLLWNQQYENSFTETNGQITAGQFWAQQTVNGYSQGYQLYVNGHFSSGANFLNLDGTDHLYVWGANGLAAANFQSTVPEPGSLLLLGSGLLGSLAAFRRKLGV